MTIPFGRKLQHCLSLRRIVRVMIMRPRDASHIYSIARCGSVERAESGPIEPPEFVDVDAEKVTHHRWATLSAGEKLRQVEEAMKECREEMNRLIAMSIAASRGRR
jgi:hypothetical protein